MTRTHIFMSDTYESMHEFDSVYQVIQPRPGLLFEKFRRRKCAVLKVASFSLRFVSRLSMGSFDA